MVNLFQNFDRDTIRSIWESRGEIMRLISFLLVGDTACATSLPIAYAKH